ncbi:hypothetical protein EDB83DRAFT_2319892 [Lactarius deliciosus]|nr:hypothetical protein EDB83DRAFT_2319892 [Lactarius deliciosus]
MNGPVVLMPVFCQKFVLAHPINACILPTSLYWPVIRKENLGEAPALHPTLAALYIVLASNGDLAEITRNHPYLCKHVYYQPGAEFPQDISDLLPSKDHCWETLAAKCRKAAACLATSKCLRLVKLLVTMPPNYVEDKSQKLPQTTYS